MPIPFWSPEHLGKSQLDLHPCRHSAEEGEQKQVWELSRQPESHWPCKYMEGETGGEMHSLTRWVRGALFFYRQEWGMSSQKWERSPRAPSLGCWTCMKQSLAATNLVQAMEDGDRDADEGQSPLSCTHKPHKHGLAHWLKGWVVLRYFWYWCHFFGRWRYWYLKRYKKVLFNAKFNFLSLNQAKKLNLFFSSNIQTEKHNLISAALPWKLCFPPCCIMQLLEELFSSPVLL